ncbi:MAG TPA: CHAD domain-containing protein [Nevskiaceae bacterium]|nr:CHAD domain-containing protein [Nevskiaceae bacterium]
MGLSELLLLPLDQVLRMLEPLPERPKDVHLLRVSIRRLRARLSAFRALVGTSRRETLDDGLAWLSDQLAPVREWDVILADLPERASSRGGNGEDLQEAVAEKRRKALRYLHKSLTGKRALHLRRDLIGLRRLLSDGEPRDAGSEQELLARSREAIARRLRKFKERYVEASQAPEADALHRLRLEAKKLRYTLEMLQQACPEAAVEKPLETLVGLQDRLGAEQDAVVERQRLARLSKSFKMPHRKTPVVPPADTSGIRGACRRAMRQI